MNASVSEGSFNSTSSKRQVYGVREDITEPAHRGSHSSTDSEHGSVGVPYNPEVSCEKVYYLKVPRIKLFCC